MAANLEIANSFSGSTHVFKLSRLNKDTNRLTLGEYSSKDLGKSGNKFAADTDESGRTKFGSKVKSAARLCTDTGFLSGSPLAYLYHSNDGEDEVGYSFEKENEMNGVLLNFKIQLTPEQLSHIMAEVEKLGTKLSEPSCNNGVSTLFGYQLHLKLAEVPLGTKTNVNGWETVSLFPGAVESVKIVCMNDADFFHVGQVVNVNMLTRMVFKTEKKGKVMDADTLRASLLKGSANNKGAKKGNTMPAALSPSLSIKPATEAAGPSNALQMLQAKVNGNAGAGATSTPTNNGSGGSNVPVPVVNSDAANNAADEDF